MNRSLFWAIGLFVSVAAAGLTAAEKPLEELGRATQWFLAFANDPYDAAGKEITELEPTLAVRALRQAIRFPADGDPQEQELIARFAKENVSDVPKSLREFVSTVFDAWKRETGKPALKLAIEQVSGAAAANVRRDGDTIIFPVAAIGRDIIRATRDETGLFKTFMWTFSHPRFSTRHPSRVSDEYDLTPACAAAIPGKENLRCDGFAFYASRREDVLSSVKGFEAKITEHLRDSFASVSAEK